MSERLTSPRRSPRETVQLCNAERGAFLPTQLDCLAQSGSIRRLLPRLDLGELGDYRAALCGDVTGNGVPLRIQPEAALALLVGADAEITNPFLGACLLFISEW